MSMTPFTFSGMSKYGQDFQSIVNRTVAIASLPVQALENDRKTVLEEKTAFSNLRNSVGGFAASMEALGKLSAGGAISVSSSSSAVTATLGAGASTGTYQISDITSLAVPAVATSIAGWATANATNVSTDPDHKVELLIDGVSQEITLTAATDNLNGLRDAINALGGGTSASVIDTGAEAAGGLRYFLVLAAHQAGQQTLEFRTKSGDIASATMEMTNLGSSASFKVNGRLVTSNDNSVSGVIPGVDLRLNSTSGQMINISLSSNSSPVVGALNSFVSAYNSLAANLDSHVGGSGGALSGNSIISDIYSRLREATGLQAPGNIKSLAQIGITLDVRGVMSFDSNAVSTAGESRLKDILTYLGSSTTGLSALTKRFTEISDPISGAIRQSLTSLDQTDARLTLQIDTMSERITDMQITLMAKLQAADGLLARLEGQQSMLLATIGSLNMVTNGKSEG